MGRVMLCGAKAAPDSFTKLYIALTDSLQRRALFMRRIDDGHVMSMAVVHFS